MSKHPSLPSKFASLPKPPKELRHELWDLALPVPRILKVCKAGYSRMKIDKFVALRYRCIDARTLPMPLLQYSQEARQATLRRYQLPFSGLIKCGPIYLDYERYSLLFMNYSALQWFCGDRDFNYFHSPPAAVREW
jgi:hypothetical protein